MHNHSFLWRHMAVTWLCKVSLLDLLSVDDVFVLTKNILPNCKYINYRLRFLTLRKHKIEEEWQHLFKQILTNQDKRPAYTFKTLVKVVVKIVYCK